MCQTLPGLRCAAHARASINQLNKSLNALHSSPAATPTEILKNKEQERKVLDQLDTALQEWAMTSAGQKELRANGQSAYADNALAIRERRKETTKQLNEMIEPYETGQAALPDFPEYKNKDEAALLREKDALGKRSRALRKNLTTQINENAVDNSLLVSISVVRARQLAIEGRLSSLHTPRFTEEDNALGNAENFRFNERGQVTGIAYPHELFEHTFGHEPSFAEFTVAGDNGFFNAHLWTPREDGSLELDWSASSLTQEAIEAGVEDPGPAF